LAEELEDYGCIISNALMKKDRNQVNIKLYDFAVPVCHKTDLKMIPMHLLTDQGWKEISHVILSRDQPWDASKQDRELNPDHIVHRIKVMNGWTYIALSDRKFDDQGQDPERNKCAMQNRTTVHQVTCDHVPRQDIDSLVHTIDLSNILLSRIGERTVSGQQGTDSMSALEDQDSKEREGQDRGRDPVEQFHEDRIFNKESELNIIAPIDAEEAKLMATREEDSQEDYVAHTFSHVEPDYEEVQLIFGWMKLSSVTPRLVLLVTDTISLFHVNSTCNTRHESTYTVSLGTLTIYLEGAHCADMLHYDIAHDSDT
jgi:hypothetical protein